MRGGDGIAVDSHLAAESVARRAGIVAPESDRLAHTGKARHALLGRVVFSDRLHHYLLRPVGIGIQHIEHKAAVGKVEGTGGGTRDSAARPAQGLIKERWRRTRDTHGHGTRRVVAQLGRGRAPAEGQLVASHPAIAGGAGREAQGRADLLGDEAGTARIGTGLDDHSLWVAGEPLAGVAELEVIDLGTSRAATTGVATEIHLVHGILIEVVVAIPADIEGAPCRQRPFE